MKEKIKLFDVGGADFKLEDKWMFLPHEIEVYLFEPDERSDISGAEGCFTFSTALGSKKEQKTLFLTRKPQCSSFLKPNLKLLNRYPNAERWDIIDTQQVQVDTLNSIKIIPDFLKIDTQGSELEILHGSTEHLDKILGMEIEVSFLEIYQNQPLFFDIQSFLSKYDFEFIDFITQYRYGRTQLNRKGQLAFADALFMKPPEIAATMSPEKQTKYLSIAKAYGKEDLGDTLKTLTK